MSLRFRRRAFTLIELLVVIAIMGIIAALLFPASNYMMQSARAGACVSNLRALGAGMMMFEQEHNNCLPYASEIDPIGGGNTGVAAICLEYLSTAKKSMTAAKLACPAASWPGYDPTTTPRLYSGNYSAYGYNPALGVPNYDNAPASTPRVNLAQISRPSEVIALADGGQTPTATTLYFIAASYGNSNGKQANADTAIPVSSFQNSGLATGQTLFEDRHNKFGNCLFVDGHVEARKITEIYQKNIYRNY